MVGSAEAYALVYAIRSGLTGSQLGLLTQLPVLVGALSALLIPGFVSHRGLSRGTMLSVFVQILGLILMILWGLDAQNFGLILLGLSLYWVGGQLSAPLWMDWISSWFPEAKIRSFIAKRTAFVSLVTLVVFLGNSKLFVLMDSRSAFLVIFSIALTARVGSFIVFLFHPKAIVRYKNSPPETLQAGDRSYLAPLKNSFLLGLIILIVAFKFSVGVAAPFFAAFKLEDLQITNMTYVYLTALPFLTRALAQHIVGMKSIRFPPLLVLFLSMLGVAAVALLYGFAGSTRDLIFPEILGGAAWAFFELALILAIRAQTSGARRSLMGLIAALGSSALLLGGLLGGSLLDAHFTFADIFLLAAALRAGVAFCFLIYARHLLSDTPGSISLGSALSSLLSIRPSLGAIGRSIPIRQKPPKNKSREESLPIEDPSA